MVKQHLTSLSASLDHSILSALQEILFFKNNTAIHGQLPCFVFLGASAISPPAQPALTLLCSFWALL